MKLTIGIVGCGNISAAYAKSLRVYPDVLHLVGAADLLPDRAQAFAKQHGGRAYPSIPALLADRSINTVVNLTPFSEHAKVTKLALLAGKHVFSEKPLAVKFVEAKELLAIAKRRKLRLASAPITFMGEAQQTAARLIREGRLGAVKAIYAEVNHGRIEQWHPAPEAFFRAGPMYDVGVYPLALTTAFFGPVKTVSAFGKILLPNRKTKDGKPYTFPTPDCFVATMELASGPILRLTANFYVQPNLSKQGECMEFHGDAGSLFMQNWFGFASPLEYAPFGGKLAAVEPVRKPTYEDAVEWSRALKEISDAVLEKRPHRASAEHALHVVEVINAVAASARRGGSPVTVTSKFTPPAPMPWAV